jgi:hypothetical protein
MVAEFLQVLLALSNMSSTLSLYQTTSISTDENNAITSAVINAYQGDPNNPNTVTTAYDMVAQGDVQVTASGVTITLSQLASLVNQASINQFPVQAKTGSINGISTS